MPRPGARQRLCASLRSRNAHGQVTSHFILGENWQEKSRAPEVRRTFWCASLRVKMHVGTSQEQAHARIYRKNAAKQTACPDLTLASTPTVRTLESVWGKTASKIHCVRDFPWFPIDSPRFSRIFHWFSPIFHSFPWSSMVFLPDSRDFRFEPVAPGPRSPGAARHLGAAHLAGGCGDGGAARAAPELRHVDRGWLWMDLILYPLIQLQLIIVYNYSHIIVISSMI